MRAGRRLLERGRHSFLRSSIGRWAYRYLANDETSFHCPVCRYVGPFGSVFPETGKRPHAICLGCGAMERHRLQWMVLKELYGQGAVSLNAVLHIAPEEFFQKWLSSQSVNYVSADLDSSLVSCRLDIRKLPFSDQSFDLVFASHVLEHVRDDVIALLEIKRVLKVGGCAVLPVPIVAESTVEYSTPNPGEFMHVRAPGKDYFERYRSVFPRADVFSSRTFSEKHQLWIYENRMGFPCPSAPERPSQSGIRHEDFVPVCYRDGGNSY